ncbi:olfactory receptor 5AR1-like [Rhinophrynus dorsalis]
MDQQHRVSYHEAQYGDRVAVTRLPEQQWRQPEDLSMDREEPENGPKPETGWSTNITEGMNQTNVTVMACFVLAGISDFPQMQAIIFILVLFIYLITLGGNVTILFLIFKDSRLHTPMYFFLCNLSCLDIMYTTVTLHRIFFTFISGDKSITFQDCFTQLYFFMSLIGSEFLILTAMSYDRYVAICNPLHYHIVMNQKVCIVLATICWALGFLDTLPFIHILYRFSCYKSRVINHFFCDLLALMKISCSDTSLLEHTLLAGAVLTDLTPFLLTIISYICIINIILKIQSATGRKKAFYTCSSHLTVVILFYVTLTCLYLRPASMFSLKSEKWLALMYTAIVPMLNPLIYSLKNKDVKSALNAVLKNFSSPLSDHVAQKEIGKPKRTSDAILQPHLSFWLECECYTSFTAYTQSRSQRAGHHCPTSDYGIGYPENPQAKIMASLAAKEDLKLLIENTGGIQVSSPLSDHVAQKEIGKPKRTSDAILQPHLSFWLECECYTSFTAYTQSRSQRAGHHCPTSDYGIGYPENPQAKIMASLAAKEDLKLLM